MFALFPHAQSTLKSKINSIALYLLLFPTSLTCAPPSTTSNSKTRSLDEYSSISRNHRSAILLNAKKKKKRPKVGDDGKTAKKSKAVYAYFFRSPVKRRKTKQRQRKEAAEYAPLLAVKSVKIMGEKRISIIDPHPTCSKDLQGRSNNKEKHRKGKEHGRANSSQ